MPGTGFAVVGFYAMVRTAVVLTRMLLGCLKIPAYLVVQMAL